MAIDISSPRSRRALLAGAVGGAIALAAQAIGRPLPAAATDGDVVHVGDDLSGTGSTSVTSSATALVGTSTGSAGIGIHGLASATSGKTAGVLGESASTDGIGVSGVAAATSGKTAGLYGETASAAGYAVYAVATATTGTTYGVAAKIASTDGAAIGGVATATSGATYGAFGQTASTEGAAVAGFATGGAPAVVGGCGPVTSDSGVMPNTGVYGYSTRDGGRGGVFAGPAAQLRLMPSTAVSHPPSGQLGDVFLDASGRLWLCRGGTSWVQLA